MKRVRLRKDIAAAVRRGHPWAFGNAVQIPKQSPKTGELVALEDRKGSSLGWAIFDADSPIALRILGPAQSAKHLICERIDAAVALRKWLALDSNAIRLLHGEADGLPGFVADFYDGFVIVRCDGAAPEIFYEPYVQHLVAACDAAGFAVKGVWRRSSRRGALGDGLVSGAAPPEAIEVFEGAVRFLVDPVNGHKTGFFLDQKNNRATVAMQSAGQRVLDLYCYTGGFGVSAAVGGAEHVTLVDAAKPAIRFAERNLQLNEIDARAYELHHGDVFAFLDQAATKGRNWDLIVCDPPSFAPSAAAKPKALAAYRRLHRACLRLLPPGGVLATASCSSHVTSADLLGELGAASLEIGRSVAVTAQAGASPDHPVNPAFPEGDYLSFALVQAR